MGFRLDAGLHMTSGPHGLHNGKLTKLPAVNIDELLDELATGAGGPGFQNSLCVRFFLFTQRVMGA